MEKLKILLLNANRRGIGTYHRAHGFARQLARLGHYVTLATVSPSPTWRPRWEAVEGNFQIVETPGALYTWWPGWAGGPADVLWRAWHVLTSDYDVVYGFSHHPDVLVPLVVGGILKGTLLLQDWCDWHAGGASWFRGIKLAHWIDGFFEELPVRRARAVTVISTVLRDRAVRAGADPTCVHIVREGVDTGRLFPIPKQEARRKFGVPQNQPVLGTLTGGNPTRPIHVFAAVLRAVPDALLLIVGRATPETTACIEQHGLAEHVIQTGWVDDADLPGWLSCADVLFFLLDDRLVDQARWPHKVGDYMAVGRPVVITRVGDIADFIEKHGVGLVASQEETDIVEKIVSLLTDSDRAAEMGRRGRETAVTVLDWRHRVDELEHILQLALRKRE